jgi:hypothetical protein
MSMVTVHGPNTMYSKAVVGNPSGSAYATPNPTNGLIWTFQARDQSQPAANYDWAYTGAAGVPASPIADTKAPVVTLPAGAHTVTLTLNGVAQAPFTITAVAGAGPTSGLMSAPDEGDGEEQVVEDDAPDEVDVEVGYDPAAHTVTEVIGFVEDNPDELEDIISAEQAGKQRVTLLTHLESMRDES